MKKFSILLALVSVLGLGAIAHAGCTQEEAQQKAVALSAKIQEVARKDPNRIVAVNQDMQAQLPELRKNPNDIEAICKFYDDMLARLQ